MITHHMDERDIAIPSGLVRQLRGRLVCPLEDCDHFFLKLWNQPLMYLEYFFFDYHGLSTLSTIILQSVVVYPSLRNRNVTREAHQTTNQEQMCSCVTATSEQTTKIRAIYLCV